MLFRSREELLRAARACAARVANGELDASEISEADFEQHLWTHGLPAVDLVIRTSGEMRLSNFLLWQAAYAEIFVTKTLWPDFRGIHLLEAIQEFQKRERRYGGLNEPNGDVAHSHSPLHAHSK